MGLDYSYDLIFPQDELWSVVQSVSAIQRPGEQIDVVFPDRTITLPFSSKFKTEPIYFDESTHKLDFDTSLFFKTDNFIKKDFRESGCTPARDKHGRVAIGNIYLTIHINPGSLYYLKCSEDVCTFSFTAATSGMSRLFQSSPFIRKAFLQLLERHNGVCGIFDDEETFPILWPPELAGNQLSWVLSEVQSLVCPSR